MGKECEVNIHLAGCVVYCCPQCMDRYNRIFCLLIYGGTNLPKMYRYDCKAQSKDRVKLTFFFLTRLRFHRHVHFFLFCFC